MAPARPHSAFCLLAWVVFACASKQGSDVDASPREGTGGTSMIGGSGVSPAAGTSSAGSSAGGRAGGPSGGAASAGSADKTSGAPNTGGGGSAAGASGDFEQECLARAADACEQCLCSSCTEQLQACAATAGCPELLVCIRDHHCQGIACYCGTFDALACANGEANGPCKAAILDAPGGRVPTLLSPSAGPASDAALAISRCEQSGQPCAQACSSK
jgi:hypothetical protein